ncbi:MAG: hypothetical protein KDK70_27970 [Myxococcales bacterium]|nr:hypothetical protein [Myxococcales bacterium]
MRRPSLAVGALLLSLGPWACFDPGGGAESSTTSTGPTTVADGPASCVPGELQPCVCPTGAGNQACNAEGTAFGPCECVGDDETGPSSSTGPSGSTGPSETTQGTTDPGDTTAGSTGPGESSGETTMGVAETGPGSSSGGFGPLAIGEECMQDADCMTGVCWDFSDYDPLCFGTACSLHCVSNMECVAAMTMAGAPNPGGSSCGADGRCSTLGTWCGAYACAGPSGGAQ